MTGRISRPPNIRPGPGGRFSISRAGLSPLLGSRSPTAPEPAWHTVPSGAQVRIFIVGTGDKEMKPSVPSCPGPLPPSLFPGSWFSHGVFFPETLGNRAFVSRGFRANGTRAGCDRTELSAQSSGDRERERPRKGARSSLLSHTPAEHEAGAGLPGRSVRHPPRIPALAWSEPKAGAQLKGCGGGDAPAMGQGHQGHLRGAPPTSSLRPLARDPRQRCPRRPHLSGAGGGRGASTLPYPWWRRAGGALAPRGPAEQVGRVCRWGGHTCAGRAPGGLRWAAGGWLAAGSRAGVGERLGSACTGGRPSREGL